MSRFIHPNGTVYNIVGVSDVNQATKILLSNPDFRGGGIPEGMQFDPGDSAAVPGNVGRPAGEAPQRIDSYTEQPIAMGRNIPIPGVSTESTPNLRAQTPYSQSIADARPVLEYGGLALGGFMGGPAGAGLLYAGGKGIADYAEGNQPATFGEALAKGALDVGTGTATEMGGQVAGKAIAGAGKVIKNVGTAAIGKLTGAGKAAAEEAAKGSEAFTAAMRGKITGDDVVNNAKEALQIVKAQRAAAYQAKLSELKGQASIDTRPIKDRLQTLMDQYGVKVGNKNTLDTSRTALGEAGNRDVRKIIETVRGWGSKAGDNTPLGLDTLKRQLDDFYSDSSNARAFVADLRNKVKQVISESVPEYATMTKDYAEATKLIKDVEAGLMLRKQGMSGRVTADQTLRRLISAMKDNFQLRRELVGVLGNQAGQDLTGQVAGTAMSDLLPKGLAGIPASMAGAAAAFQYLNPKFVPLIALSSPRLSGEFLRILGKAAGEVRGASVPVGRATGYMYGLTSEQPIDKR